MLHYRSHTDQKDCPNAAVFLVSPHIAVSSLTVAIIFSMIVNLPRVSVADVVGGSLNFCHFKATVHYLRDQAFFSFWPSH